MDTPSTPDQPQIPQSTEPPGGGGGPAELPGLPWENRDQLGMAVALFETFKGVLLEPTESFRKMRRDGGLGEPLLFSVILGTIGGWASIVWQVLLSAIGPLMGGGDAMSGFMESLIGMAILAVLMPGLIVIGLFINAAIVHLFAMMFDAAKNGFEVTFRVTAYAQGSANLLNLIPILGGLAAGIWSIVATIIGLTEAQETTGGRAAGAVLTPIAICCVCLLIAGVALFFGLAASLSNP